MSKAFFAVIVVMCLSCVALASFVDSSLITVTPSGNWPGAEATNLINGSGFMPDLTVQADPTDTKNWLCNINDGRWLPEWRQGTYLRNYSPSGVSGDGWVQFEFATAQEISKMWVWNYNNPNYLGRGWESVAIDYSTDGTTWTRMGGGDTYLTFAQAPGTDGYECNNIIDFGGITVKKVVLTLGWATGNYGDPSYAGLSEVRFEEVPEPATMLLLGLGGLGMLRRKRA